MSDENPNWPAYSVRQQLERMPQVAQRRYRRLQSARADLAALIRSTMEEEKAVEDKFFDLQRRHDYAQRPGGVDTEAAKLKREFEAVAADQQELFGQRSRRNARKGNLDQVLSRIDNWISALMIGSGVAAYYGVADVPDVKLRKNETLADAVERERGRLYELQGELATLRRMPLPGEELLQRARVFVNDLGLKGAPLVITEGGKFEVKMDPYSVAGYPAPAETYVPRFMAALFPDQVYALLVAQIADRPGIAAGERAERSAALEAEIFCTSSRRKC